MPGDIIAGKYRVDSVIAVGGMGIVLSAQHLQLGQEVAIKVLLPTELAEEPHAATRFMREARAAACIKSEHVVRIFDVDSLPSELPYMVMERLNGSDLRALLRAEGPLPIADVVEYVTQACDAIGEAHRMGIVHRDLKPSNLFLTRRNDGSPLVKVLDFGISKAFQQAALEGTLTTSRTLIGSPMYMSPEQIRDPKAVDARSDIWSIGIILHQLLTGKPAFSADSLPGVCAAIAADPPASTRERRSDVPEALERVIQKCLEKRPEARFQSVGELCAALAPFGLRAPVSSTGNRLRPQVEPEPDKPGESSVDAPTISHGRMLRDPAALGSLPLSDAPLAATQRSESGRRMRIAIPALVLALGGAAALLFVLRPWSDEPATGAVARPESFSLRVESTPSGAEVFDGDRLLGRTPLEIRLQNADLEREAKRFTLRMAGRLSYVVEQGPSAVDTTLRGRLDPVPEPIASSGAPEPAAAASGTPRVRPKPGAKPPPASTGTDIRLER